MSTLDKLIEAVAQNSALAVALDTALSKFTKEQEDVVARERDNLKAENRELYKRLAERDERIKKLTERLQQEKAFNFAHRYGVPDAFKVENPSFSVYEEAAPFLDPKLCKITANVWCSQPVWNLLTLHAACLIRGRYARTPVVRTVLEWNLAAENLKNNMPERHDFRWTRSEEEKLVADYRARKPLEHFTRIHKRHPDAIVRRIAKLVGFVGLAKRRAWESEDAYTARLRGMYLRPPNSRFVSVLRKPGFEPKYTTYTG